ADGPRARPGGPADHARLADTAAARGERTRPVAPTDRCRHPGLGRARLCRPLRELSASTRLSDAFKSLDARVDVGADAQNHAADISATVPDTLSAFVGLAGNVCGFFFLIFELIFLTLFLLCDLPQFSDSIEGMLYPDSARRYHGLREQITTSGSRYAVGAVLIGTIAGTVMGLTAWLVGAPYPLA